MAIELTENCTQVEMGVGEGFGVLKFEFELKCLNKVGEGGSDFAGSAVVAGKVVIGGGFEL